MKRLNPIDLTIIASIILALAGFALAKAGYAGVDKVIEGTHRVHIDVYLIGLKTLDTEILKEGEKSAITIRNRPVQPPMTITSVKHWPHKASFLKPDASGAIAFEDPATPYAHDFLVSLEDEADATSDGFVIRGNKVKIGNLIELEGYKYRAQGVVVDIGVVQAKNK